MKGIAEKETHREYLDGLRGIAVLMVLFAHAYVGPGEYESHYFTILKKGGNRGVQLFFMLSAFTLFLSSRRRFFTESTPRINFYIRRAFRILPLWWLAVLFYGLQDGKSFQFILASMSFLWGFLRFIPSVDVVSVGWSLFVEETFYLMLPLLFFKLNSKLRSLQLLVILFFVSMAWEKLGNRLVNPDPNDFVLFFPLSQWFCFPLGILLFHLLDDPRFIDRMNQFLTNVRPLFMLDLFVILVLFRTFFGDFMIPSLMLVFVFLLGAFPQTLIGKLCRQGWLRSFGICCYSIYLFHLAIIYKTLPLADWFFRTLGVQGASKDTRTLIWFPVLAGICLLFGKLSFYMVEKPSVDLGRSLIRWLGGSADTATRETQPSIEVFQRPTVPSV